MKFKTKIGMLPLAISLSANAMGSDISEFKFSENDIMNKLIDVDKHALSYLKSYNNAFSKIYLKDMFLDYEAKWNKQTRYSSFADEIINNENFQKIIKMKQNAIPWILESINEKPSALVWALNLITGAKISQSQTLTVTEACKLWVKWGKSQKFI